MQRLHYTLAFTLSLVISTALSQAVSRDEAVQIALKNNQSIRAAEYQVDYFREMKKTGSDIGKMSFVWIRGQYNSIVQDDNFTLTQTLPFPTAIGSQVKLGKEQLIGSQKNLMVAQNNLVFEVKSVYEQLLYQNALQKLHLTQDSLYADFAKASALRYKTGESNLLEKTTAETQLLEVKNLLKQNEADIQILETKLQALLKSDASVIAADVLNRLLSDSEISYVENNPQLAYFKQQVNISQQFKKVERNKLMPDILLGYFNQSLVGVQNIDGQDQYFGRDKHFQGFQLGFGIPLWFAPHVARSKAAAFQEEASRKNAEYYETSLNSEARQALQELDKNLASLNYYESSALTNADLILSQSRKAYRAGEIGYIEYLQALRNAITIKSNYLIALTQYNHSIIKLQFLSGNTNAK